MKASSSNVSVSVLTELTAAQRNGTRVKTDGGDQERVDEDAGPDSGARPEDVDHARGSRS